MIYRGKFYDSKPLVWIAHELSDGVDLNPKFSGGDSNLGWLKKRLGFHVDESGWLYKISNIQKWVNPKYQYLVLLWAISRVKPSCPRIVAFDEVREELAELLAPFAEDDPNFDPIMPWVALAAAREIWESSAWETRFNESSDQPTSLESIVRTNFAAQNGGLSAALHSHIEWSGRSFLDPALYFFDSLLGAEPGYIPLLGNLGLLHSSDSAENSELIEECQASLAIEDLLNPRKSGRNRLTAEENKAIEEQAVAVTREHFEKTLGYRVDDVGKTHSYDLHATKGQAVIKVEVKGTTTDGRQIVLTRNEVNLHRQEHPNNALAIVRNITLERTSPPIVEGGELVLLMPWMLNNAGLDAIAYEYETGI